MKETIFRALIILFAIGLIIIGVSGMAKSQTVSISPSSVQLWGQTPSIAKLSAEYKDIELIGLVPYRKYDFVMPTTGEYKGRSNDFNIGLFYKPLSASTGKFSVGGGAGLFIQEFPTPQGSIINFSLEVSYQVSDFVSVEYQHLSNGFGIQDSFNPGGDWLSIKYHL